MKKRDYCLCENRRRSVTAKLISAFVFATRIVEFLFYLNPKFQVSSSFLSLYRPVCVGPGRKPRRPVFSRRGSIMYVSPICIRRLVGVHVYDFIHYKMSLQGVLRHWLFHKNLQQ